MCYNTRMTDDQKPAPPPRPGDLQVWFIPRIPGKIFERRVASASEARAVLDALALYTLFLEDEAGLMGDHANAGGVSAWETDGEGGFAWYDVEVDDLDVAEPTGARP